MMKEEDPLLQVGKLCRMMHPGVFDRRGEEDFDMHKVMKDVYNNFSCICKVTIAQLKSLDLSEYEEDVKLFVRFFRCALKWCVGVDGVIINESLVHDLTAVELHFFDLAEYVLKCRSVQGSDGDAGVPSKDEIEGKVNDNEHLVQRVTDAYALVLNDARYCSPSNLDISGESVVEFLDEILVKWNNCGSDKSIDSLKDNLRFLRNYLEFTKDWVDREKLLGLSIRAEAMVDKIARYFFLDNYCHIKYELFWKIKDSLGSEVHTGILNVLLLQIDLNPPLPDQLLVGFGDCLIQNLCILLNDTNDLQGPVKDQFLLLSEVMTYVVHLLVNILPKYAEQDKLRHIKMQFQDVGRDVGYVIMSSFNHDMKESTATDVGFVLSDLLEKLKLLKQDIVEIIVPIFLDRLRKKFPRTDQMAFLNFLLENMRESMDCKSDMLTDSMDQFQKIHEDLLFFRSFLQNIASNSNTSCGSKDISNCIMSLAYEAEYITNTFVVGACPGQIKSLWISDLMEQVKQTKAAVVDIIERKSNTDEIEVASKDPSQSILPTIDAPSQELVSTTDVMVGFEVEMELTKERLTNDFNRLDVVSIIGMPGLGKTTLAKKVYEDPFIVDHFQIRSWCCVSQEYNKKELLLTILGSITEITDLICRKSGDDLSVMLHQQLIGRRYLIVMDDLWGMEAFEDLKRFFPVNSNGSRIMLTSRNKLLGLEEKYHSDPLELRLLTDDESWDLLKQKVYNREECPLELCEVGKEIAEKCRGLPLAVVVVAGLLAKSDKKQDLWKQVVRDLSLHIAGNTQKQVMAVLELSYKLLPNHLKPLFLYLGAFPEDNEIPAKKLIWLWIAEGFVRRTELRSLEVEAEMNLMDLIDRSLLMVAERRSDGKVKACRFHDLLRDMCLTKAKEENFLQQIQVHGQLPDSVVYQRRVSICPQNKYGDNLYNASPRPFVTSENLPMLPVALPLHSALLFIMNKDIESALSNSKLLRVLHCESTSIGDYLLGNVTMLVHLRYISIRESWNSVPRSISNLRNLESLIIKGLRGEITVPESIWEMVKLRHLHIDHWATFGDPVDKSSKLENLQTLSTPAFDSGEKNPLIKRLPNLQKLRCIFMNGSYNELPELESFDQLESLKVLYHGSIRPSGQFSIQFNLPSTLKKLTLSKFRLKWHEVSGLQKLLPNLEVLKLRLGAVHDELWDMEDVEFFKLKYLKLESLNIKSWNVSPENFPCLKKLVLQYCRRLEIIPSSVGDFYSLEKMEVLWSSPSAAKSAKLIQEEQKDAGNEMLSVHIYPPVLDL